MYDVEKIERKRIVSKSRSRNNKDNNGNVTDQHFTSE
jgi:hypothetical protein